MQNLFNRHASNTLCGHGGDIVQMKSILCLFCRWSLIYSLCNTVLGDFDHAGDDIVIVRDECFWRMLWVRMSPPHSSGIVLILCKCDLNSDGTLV